MFSVVNGVMLRGFSFPTADRLMGVQIIDLTQNNANVNGFGSQIFTLDYEDIRPSSSPSSCWLATSTAPPSM